MTTYPSRPSAVGTVDRDAAVYKITLMLVRTDVVCSEKQGKGKKTRQWEKGKKRLGMTDVRRQNNRRYIIDI